MKNMTLDNIARAVQGTLIFPEHEPYANGLCKADYADLTVSGVLADNRQVQGGELFIPFVGEQVDAHRFIPQAFAAGAVCVLSERELEDPAGPYIRVESTYKALADAAAYYRSTLSIPLIGIIGSVGKTSTKEMVASVLSQKFNVLKTEGNFNNEIGMPLTILKIREEHEAAVIEMGIDSFGEMSRLARVARPDMVVMTNIGQCHLENLKTRDGILAAKTEVFDYLPQNAVVVLNGDDDHLTHVTKAAGAKILFYGLGKDASSEMKEDPTVTGQRNAEIAGALDKAKERDGLDPAVFGTETYCAKNIAFHGVEGVSADFTTPLGSFSARIPLPGEHNVYNALGAAAVAVELGLTNDQIKAGMETASTIQGRSNFLHIGGVTVIDDCYNANPASMKASLSVLSKAEGRKIAVLGDMGELGSDERRLHAEVGTFAAEQKIDVLFTAGDLSEETANAAKTAGMQQVYAFASREEMTDALLAEIKKGDTVLVKASHFMNFPQVVESMKEKL